MTTQVRRFVFACVALTALLMLIPAALVAVTRRRFGSTNPFAGVAHPLNWRREAVLDALSTPLSDGAIADAIIRASLVIVWFAVAAVLASTILEVAHVVRHGGLSMPTVRGLGWAQRIARIVAGGLLALTPIVSPRLALATDVHVPSGLERVTNTVPVFESSADDTMDHPVSQPTSSTPAVHVVERGESVYSIAERLADGDPAMTARIADAILDDNLGSEMPGGGRFTNPAYIEVGWRLSIPTDVARDSGAVSSTERAADSVATARNGDGPTVVHVVEPGDTLALIAEEHLGAADQWPTLWDDNAGDDMGFGRTFDNPNLILPGWEIDVHRLATITTDRGPAIPRVADRATPHDNVSTSPAEVSAEPTPPSPRAPERAPSPTATSQMPKTTPPSTSTANTSATSTTTASPSATSTAVTGPVAVDHDGDRSEDQSSTTIGLPHATFLAGGILTLLGARRRRQLRRSRHNTRVPDSASSTIAVERTLRSLGDADRTTRLDIGVRAAAHGLIDTESQVGVVLVEPDGAINFLLTASATLAAPYVGEGRSWTLPADTPLESLGVIARPVGLPCVALVQIGTSGAADVLVDLEAIGSLAIEEPPTRHGEGAEADAKTGSEADDIVNAVAAGLASSPFAEAAHVITVSMPESVLLGHCNTHRASTVSAALEMAASIVGSTTSNPATTFALRSLRTGGEAWEPAIVVLRHDDTCSETGGMNVVARHLAAGHGLAIVGAVPTNGWNDANARLAHRCGVWTLEAFGSEIELSPIGLSPTDLNNIAQLIDDATDDLPGEPTSVDAPSVARVEHLTDEDDDRDESHDSATPFEPTPHQIVVRLLGGVDVVDVDGRPGTFERSKTVELIAWLATHRDRSTRTSARTALWELDVRDATFANVVSEARRALARLVSPTADEEWVARTLTEQLPLHDLVVTDAQLMRERLDHARLQCTADALVTLRGAVEMIRDMPFTGTSYLWPDAEGITSNLVLLATSVTTELAEHALELGDTELVFWATGQGLRVLPGHEELIGLRMQAHARAGDLAGVRVEWESYERVVVGDAWSDGEPAPKLVALRRELLASAT